MIYTYIICILFIHIFICTYIYLLTFLFLYRNKYNSLGKKLCIVFKIFITVKD